MENMLELNEFFVEGGNPERSHVLLHITEPSTPEEKKKGYFFAICEITDSNTEYIASLQSLIDDMEARYYEINDSEEKSAIETVLESANQESYSLINSESKLHCIAGVLKQNEIIFTYAGSPALLLFYKNRQGLYQKMDLTASDPSEKPKAGHLFSQIVQGKISPNDFLFAGTPHISNYFNHDRLQKIITARPASQSAEHIERVLAQLREGLSFGGLIIHLNQNSALAVKKVRTQNSKESAQSINHFIDTQENTANTLSSSFFPKFKKGLSAMFPAKTQATLASETQEIETEYMNAQISATHLRPFKRNHEEKLVTGENLINIIKQILNVLKVLFSGILKLIVIILAAIASLARGLGLLFIIITNFQNRRQSVIEGARNAWRRQKDNLRSLPIITKVILSSALILALIFFVSLLYLREKQQNEAHALAFKNATSAFNEYKDAAESALVYHDEPKALNLLDDAKNTLLSIQCQSKDEKKTCDDLNAQLGALFLRARKVQTAEASLVVDFSSVSIQNLTNLTKVNSKIFAAATGSNAVGVYDLVSARTQAIKIPNATGFSILTAPKENDYVLLIQDAKNLFQINPADLTSKSAEITFPTANPSISSAVVYNRRLYVLNGSENQIYKHDSIKTGFAQGAEWSKDSNLNLSGSTDLTIDGDLFVSKNNGEIIKLTKGSTASFAISGLNPALSNGVRLWTYNDVTYLYILDPVEKRLIILNKDGSVKAQLVSPTLVAPTDFAIDEPNKLAYIIDGTKLYKINLPI